MGSACLLDNLGILLGAPLPLNIVEKSVISSYSSSLFSFNFCSYFVYSINLKNIVTDP